MQRFHHRTGRLVKRCRPWSTEREPAPLPSPAPAAAQANLCLRRILSARPSPPASSSGAPPCPHRPPMLAFVFVRRFCCEAFCSPARRCGEYARAGVAQLVEHLICNQTVGGSSPFASSSSRRSSMLFVAGSHSRQALRSKLFRHVLSGSQAASLRRSRWVCVEMRKKIAGSSVSLRAGCAQVAEWLMAADCKSAALRSYGGSNPPLCTTSFCLAASRSLELVYLGPVCHAV
jgi:hypothetical protein